MGVLTTKALLFGVNVRALGFETPMLVFPAAALSPYLKRALRRPAALPEGLSPKLKRSNGMDGPSTPLRTLAGNILDFI